MPIDLLFTCLCHSECMNVQNVYVNTEHVNTEINYCPITV